MANTLVAVGSNDDYIVKIDSDGPDAGYYNQFIVSHVTSVGPPTIVADLFNVDENGLVKVTGRWTCYDPVTLINTTSGDIFSAMVAGSTVASVRADGTGDFSAAGIKLQVVTHPPGGAYNGTPGQIILWDDTAGASAKWHICLCITGTTWYEKEQD
jgi:hypothetical protein